MNKNEFVFSRLVKILVLVSITFNALQAQKIDSLLKVIPQQKEDTSKVLNYATVAYIYSFSDREKAKTYYDSTLALSQKLVYLNGEGQAYQGIGEYYFYHQDWAKMKENLQKAEEAFLAIKDYRRFYSIKSFYAAYYEKIGDLEQSLILKMEVLRYFEKTKELQGEAQMNGAIALLLSRMKRYDEAKSYYLKSIKIRKSLNDQRGASIALLNLGAMLSEHGKSDEALIYLNKCIEIQSVLQEKMIQTAAELNLAKVYNDKKAYATSLKYSQPCLAFYKLEKDSFNIVMSRLYMAESYLGQQKYETALSEMDSIIVANFDSTLYVDVHKMYYEIYKEMGIFSSALQHLEKVLELEQEFNRNEVQHKVSELKERYETEKKDLENQQLVKANELNLLKIKTNNYIIIGTFLLTLLIVSMLLLFVRNNKIKAREKNLLLQQKLLRSQMNPHFIFNALSSIQLYMYANDSFKAGDYLSAFARLSRGILDHSQTEAVSLEKEIQWLNDYVKLQQMRFDNEVEFILKVDENIDVYNTQVPPMLVQPFLENAFEHGFRNIEHAGILNVNYTLEEQSIVVEIKDNGAGFGPHLVQENKNGHVSQALKITKERLELLNKGKRKKVQLEIHSELNKGTLIVFRIPLLTLE